MVKKVLGIGNALVDILSEQEYELLEKFNLPKGSMMLVDKRVSDDIRETIKSTNMASGGSAANTIHTLANLGVDTAFIGKVGKDETGKFFEEDLVKNNIQSKLLHSENSGTGIATTLITPDSERTFATYLGAAIELSPEDLKSEQFQGYDYLHIEGYLVQNHALIEKAVKLAKENGLKVSIDMASYNVVEENIDFLNSILDNYIDIVFANEEEAKALTGEEPKTALNIIADRCEIAVVKIGKEGSLIKKGNQTVTVGIYNAVAVDTTGAGDSYAGGFLYGLIKKNELDFAGKVGALISSKVVENIGAKLGKDKWLQIKEKIFSNNL